jgi:predicted nucleic acid-binding protein
MFVDTSAFYAAADSGDRSHRRATEVLSAAGSLLTTDHVLVESWLLVRARGGRAAAERFWASVRGGLAAVEPVSPGDLDAAWRIGEAFPDQDFSIVDRTSFAVMERLGITSAASFDDHFSIYRFGPRRQHAFEVRR